MKSLKYTLVILLSAIMMLFPIVAIALTAYFYFVHRQDWILFVGITSTAISIALNRPLRDLRVKYRKDVEYDEYGLSKTKGKYEYLSKAERDQIDMQNVANMERLLNTTALKKMTKKGPDNPMKELNDLIGLEPMKNTVKEMVARMQFETEENKKKKKSEREPLSANHMCFTGSPGSGKTTTARILTSFLYKYGYIKENKCIEIDGNFLKAGTESALKTELVLRHAYGGVLFIDEAYALLDSGDGSGQQVIATLIKQMEDQRGKFILIIAGYTDEMKMLIDANPGFESRIKEYVHFPDYNAIEMREILQYMANKQNFVVAGDAFDVFDELVARERKLKSFGNARTVRNILDKAINRHTLNLANGIIGQEDRYKLSAIDFQNLKLGTIGFGNNF